MGLFMGLPDFQIPCHRLIQHQFMLQAEVHQDIAGAVLLHHLFVDAKVNQIPHGQVLHVHLKWQSAGILHGIEKDRSNGASNHKAPCALVWGARIVLTSGDLMEVDPTATLQRGNGLS